MLGPYNIGQQPIITATLTDVTGGVGVSSAIIFSVKRPDNTITEISSPHASITNPTPNVWKLVMPVLDQAGTWFIEGQTTAGLISAYEEALYVADSEFD